MTDLLSLKVHWFTQSYYLLYLFFVLYFFKFLVLESLFLHTDREILGFCLGQNITIHHDYPCRIGKSHPRGRKFYQGRGLPSPWLKFRPRGTFRNPEEPRNPEKPFVNLNLKSDEATKVEKFNFLTSGL